MEAAGTVNVARAQILAFVDDFTESDAFHIATELAVDPTSAAPLGVAKRSAQVLRQINSGPIHSAIRLELRVAVVFKTEA